MTAKKGAVAMKKSVGKNGKKVNFQFKAEPGIEVFLVGSFNEWNPRDLQMERNPANGHYKASVSLPPGRHEYKFVVNGQWCMDSTCLESVPNDLGSFNRVISV